MPYKPMPDITTCTNVAEALGRAYCAGKGVAWPEQPTFYTPGRQPSPPGAWGQRYWQAPLPASGPTPQDPQAPVLPIRIQVDAVALQFAGQQVATSAGPITLDFTALVADPVVVGNAVADEVKP